MKFFPTDWCGDRALRGCSLGARGLWMEMLAIMNEAAPRGSLLVNGRQVDLTKLPAIVGAEKKEVDRLFRELDDAGVFSRDGDGTIFSRRMRRDDAKAMKDRENGKGGGNPKLKPNTLHPVMPLVNTGVNPPDKAQKPEARSQKPEEAAQPVANATREDFDKVESACRKALGDLAPVDVVIGPIIALIRQGVALPAIVDVLVSEAKRPRQKPIRTWGVWATIIAERMAEAPKISAAAPSEKTYDFGGERKYAESFLISVLQNPSAYWREKFFFSDARFREAVEHVAPDLLKFWKPSSVEQVA